MKHEIRITRVHIADVGPVRAVGIERLVPCPRIKVGRIVSNKRAVPHVDRLRTAAARTTIRVWPAIDLQDVGALMPRIDRQVRGAGRQR